MASLPRAAVDAPRRGWAGVQSLMDDSHGGGAALPQLLAPTMVYASGGLCAARLRLVCKAFKDELDITIKEWTAQLGRVLEDYLESKRLCIAYGIQPEARGQVEGLYSGSGCELSGDDEETVLTATTVKFLRIVQQRGTRAGTRAGSGAASALGDEQDTHDGRRAVWREICAAHGNARRGCALVAGTWLHYADAHAAVKEKARVFLNEGVGADSSQAVRKWLNMQQPWHWNARVAPDASSVRFYLALAQSAAGNGGQCQLCGAQRHFRSLDEDLSEYIRLNGGEIGFFVDESELMALNTTEPGVFRLVRAHPSCLQKCCVPIDFLHRWKRNHPPNPCEVVARKYLNSMGAGEAERHRFRFNVGDLNIMTMVNKSLLTLDGFAWFRDKGGALMERIEGLHGVKTFPNAVRILEERIEVAGRSLRMQRKVIDALDESQRNSVAQAVANEVDELLGFAWRNGRGSAAAPWVAYLEVPLKKVHSVLVRECTKKYVWDLPFRSLLDATRASKHPAFSKLHRVVHEQLPKLWKLDASYTTGPMPRASRVAYAHFFGLDVLAANLEDCKVANSLAALCSVVRDADLEDDEGYDEDLAWERAVTLLHAVDAIRSPSQLSLVAIGEGRCRWTLFYDGVVELRGVVSIPSRDSAWWCAMKWFGTVEDIGSGSVSNAYREFNRRGLRLATNALGEDFARTTSQSLQRSFCDALTRLCRATMAHDVERRGLALYALMMGDTTSLVEAVSRAEVCVEVMQTFATFGFG